MRGERLEPGEAGVAIGGEIALLPPASDFGKQLTGSRPGRDAERGDIGAIKRENWEWPGSAKCQ